MVVPADGRTMALREKWRNDMPLLYDFFLNHHCVWPTLPCRWGPVLQTYATYGEQRLFLSEQTDGTVPNTLLVAAAAVPFGCQAQPAQLLEEWDEDAASEMVAVEKTIFHPGEVNRIRELPQHPHIVATHTDAPEVLVWNTESQPNRRTSAEDEDDDAPVEGVEPEEVSTPDLVLTGHEDNAEFALATSEAGAFVISGGRDTHVALWGLEDNVILATTSLDSVSTTPTIPARGLFKGHRDTVEDVQFKPGSSDEFCSVGDDHCLILWDARAGCSPVIRVDRAHKKDVHCVDWSPHDENYLLTGSADTTARLFDRRKLATKGHSLPVQTFANIHSDAVVQVQWCPDAEGVFATAGDDGVVNVISARPSGRGSASASAAAESKLLQQGDADVRLKHLGHRDKISDFHWSPHFPWTILSCSVDSGKGGGGTVQIWRPLQLLQLPQEDALQKLDSWQKTCILLQDA